ncbi:MAG TPA: hypothetical protein VGK32_16355 [Vicinamibacterales bacterium]|jgi:hypothetical protein
MKIKLAVWSLLVVLVFALSAAAQTPPRLVRFSGVVRDAQGVTHSGAATLTFAIYAEAEGGTPLWSEAQALTLDADGRYAVVLGATRPEGLPLDIFASGEARWLGVHAEGVANAPRVLLVSVPYALKAADAETVGGKPLSAFVLAGDKTGVGTDGLTYVDTRVLKSGLAAAAPGTQAATAGTQDYLARFAADGVSLTNSALYQSSTRIGVGTAAPAATVHIAAPESPAIFFEVVNNNLGALPAIYRVARGTPGAMLPVQTNDILGGLAARAWNGTSWSAGVGQVMFRAAENWTATANGSFLQLTTTPTGGTQWVERMRITPDGNVGIGVDVPDSKLHVVGAAHITGDTVVDGNIAAKYQDVAEWVESVEPLEAGTVVVVDPTAANGVRPSTTAYDVAVAGAVSAQPGLTLGERGASKSLVAQSGRVRVKVDARYGAIKAGDLLVTSPTPGHAMRSKPTVVHGVAMHRPGTIVGKALEPLASGRGAVLVLLTLQ